MAATIIVPIWIWKRPTSAHCRVSPPYCYLVNIYCKKHIQFCGI